MRPINRPSTSAEAGFSLIEVMIGVVVVAVLAMAIADTSRFSRKLAAQRSDLVAVDIFRRNIVRLIRDQVAWKKTITNPSNGAMACLAIPNATCSAPGNPKFDVYNPDGTAFYKSTTPDAGFDARGKPCTGFSEYTWSGGCPFRYDLNWTPVTGASSPLVAISITLKVSPGGPKEYSFMGNPKRYSIPVIYRPAQLW